MPFTSKVKKSVSCQKWKKSQDQLRQKATRQKGTSEWKMVKPKESEITSHKGNRERLGFSEMSMEIKEFRARGSFDPKFIHPSLISNRPDYVLEKSVAVDDVVMSMGSPSDLETNGNTKQNSSLQEPVRQSLAKISPNHHEEGANQTSSMEIKVGNISKTTLKRIDPKLRSKKAGRKEEINPSCDQDDEAFGNPTNG